MSVVEASVKSASDWEVCAVQGNGKVYFWYKDDTIVINQLNMHPTLTVTVSFHLQSCTNATATTATTATAYCR
jgi:hypothetical protein